MCQIKKIDYMVGAFLSYLTSKPLTSILVEETENAKKIKFSTNNENYRIYFKYSIGSKPSTIGGKKYIKWDVAYTENDIKEIEELENSQNVKTFILNMCTNKEFKDTEIAVLSIKELRKCIGNDIINKNKRLSIRYMKNSPQFECYGTNLDRDDSIRINRRFETII